VREIPLGLNAIKVASRNNVKINRKMTNRFDTHNMVFGILYFTSINPFSLVRHYILLTRDTKKILKRGLTIPYGTYLQQFKINSPYPTFAYMYRLAINFLEK